MTWLGWPGSSEWGPKQPSLLADGDQWRDNGENLLPLGDRLHVHWLNREGLICLDFEKIAGSLFGESDIVRQCIWSCHRFLIVNILNIICVHESTLRSVTDIITAYKHPSTYCTYLVLRSLERCCIGNHWCAWSKSRWKCFHLKGWTNFVFAPISFLM